MKTISLKALLIVLSVISAANMQAFDFGRRRGGAVGRIVAIVERQRPAVVVVKERSSLRDVAAAVDLAVNAYEYPLLTAAVVGGIIVCAAALNACRSTRADYVVVEESPRPTTTTVYVTAEPRYEDEEDRVVIIAS